jgi:hypothetical protein
VFDGIHRMWVGGTADIRISKAEYVEKVLCDNTHMKKSYVYALMRPWLGNGLLLSDGKQKMVHQKTSHGFYQFA